MYRERKDINLKSPLGAFKHPQYHRSDIQEPILNLPEDFTIEAKYIPKKSTINELIRLLDSVTRLFYLLDNESSLSQEIVNDLTEILPDFLLAAMNAEACVILKAERATIFIYDEDRGQLWSKVAKSDDTEKFLEIRIPITAGIAGYVAQTRRPFNTKDAYKEKQFNPEIDQKIRYKTHNVLCVPIFNSTNKLIGVIQVLNKHGGKKAFDDKDKAELCRFAERVGYFLEVVELKLNKAYQKIIDEREFRHSVSSDMPWIPEIEKGDSIDIETLDFLE